MMFPRRRSRAGLATLLTTIFTLAALSTMAPAKEIEKIPIEQAIKESRQAHEMCRLNKIRAWQKARSTLQALGPLGALPTQYQYDARFYRIDLDVDIDIEILWGVVDLVAAATQDNVTFCEIDLHGDMTVDSIRVNGIPAIFTHLNDLITVDLPTPVDEGEEFTITTFYHGHPTEGGFQAFEFSYHGGSPAVSTLSEPYFARTWWPCKDYPDDKADSVHVIITYPSELLCTSNGIMVSNIDNLDGTRTTYWVHRYPITTYLVSLAMSAYSHWQDVWQYGLGETMTVDYWVFPDRLAAAQSGWAATTDMLDTLSDRFGLYPFTDEKYAMSMFQWGGAMEHQTNTSMGTYATYQSITVHELAHQWFGDMITCRDWQNIWMNEGFATYSEALWYESLNGFPGLQSYMNGMFYSGGGTIYCQDTTDVWSIFSTRVYDKGAWVLHMLRHLVGDDTFFDILHTYYDDPDLKWGTATTEDFRDICEAVSGLELDDFFQDWIYGEYYPKYVTSFAYDELAADSFRLYVQVRQEQTSSPQVFHMSSVDLSVYDGNGYHDLAVPMTARVQDYIFDIGGLAGPPIAAEVDRNDWILKNHRTESYLVHIVCDSLRTGLQFSAYADSVIVRGGAAPYNFAITAGTLPAGLSLEPNSGVVSGSPSDTGYFEFTVQVSDNGSNIDTNMLWLRVDQASYTAGDPDGNGIVNVSDAVYLIAYVFAGGPAPSPLAAGDVNADCVVGVSDAVYLISYIFSDGPAPLPGCAK